MPEKGFQPVEIDLLVAGDFGSDLADDSQQFLLALDECVGAMA